MSKEKEMIKGLSNEFNLTRLAGHVIGDNTDKSPIEIGNLIVRAFDSQGVVIKVEREYFPTILCPSCSSLITSDVPKRTGYEVVEPLIER